MSHAENTGGHETFDALGAERIAHNALVSSDVSLEPQILGALASPQALPVLWAAQVDRVAAQGEWRTALVLRSPVRATFKQRIPQDIQQYGYVPSLRFFDQLLLRVGTGDCETAELQLVADIFHQTNNPYSLVPRSHSPLRFLAPQLFDVPPFVWTPHTLKMQWAADAMQGYARDSYPKQSRYFLRPNYAQIVVEAELLRRRGWVERANPLNCIDTAREQRFLGARGIEASMDFKGMPSPVADIFRDCVERCMERERMERNAASRPLRHVGGAFLGALGVTIEPKLKKS